MADGDTAIDRNKFWQSSSLHRSLTAILLVNLFVVGLISYVLFGAYQQNQERALAAAENLSRIIDENLTGFVEKVDIALVAVIDELDREDRGGRLNDDSVESILRKFESHLPATSAIRVVNASGRIDYSVGPMRSDGRDIADRDYFLRHRDNPDAGLLISKPLVSRLTGQRVVVLSRRRDGPGHGFAGIVTVVISLDTMSAYLGHLDLGPQGVAALWQDDQTVLVRYPAVAPGSKAGPSEKLRALIQHYDHPTGYHAASGFDGIERQYFVRKLERWPLLLNVGIADADLLAGWRRTIATLGFLAVGFLCGSMMAAATLIRRRQSELILEQNEERFRLAMEATSDGLWDWDVLSDRTYFSPSYFRVLGYEPDEFPMTGEAWANRLHPEDLPKAIAANRECIENRADSFSVEFRMLAKDGGWRWILGRGRAVTRDPDGRATRMIGTHLDITERKRTEDRLIAALAAAEDAARAKSLFLAMMSHEIRTPLSGVVGIAELMADSGLDSGQREQVETIRTSAQALLAVIDNILDLTKMDADRIELAAAPFDLAKVVGDVGLILRSQAAERGLALSVEVAAGMPPVRLGDASRLRQVLLNLVGNAIKFTERGGICVRVAPDGDDRVRFEVEDSGIGFDAGLKEQLFQDFTQADPTISRRYGGSGLGLAICRRLIGLMGGRIDARSIPGQGSVFDFVLPLPACAPPAAIAAVAQPAFRAPLNLLLAEDNPVNAMVLEAMLRKAGHQVTVVQTGRAAVDAVRSRDFDTILMDMQMPEMDGLTATRAIRRMPGSTSRIPVIGITANAFPEDRQRCLDAGMNAHLSKPVTLATLAAAIEACSTG